MTRPEFRRALTRMIVSWFLIGMAAGVNLMTWALATLDGDEQRIVRVFGAVTFVAAVLYGILFPPLVSRDDDHRPTDGPLTGGGVA